MTTHVSTQLQSVAEVAVPLPIVGTFSYGITEDLQPSIQAGIRVRVPFKNRSLTGYVTSYGTPSTGTKLKTIEAILDKEPVLSDAMLKLTRWISEYYGCSWGEAIENALPKWVKYGKKADRALAKEDPAFRSVVKEAPQTEFRLTPDQEKAFGQIQQSLNAKKPEPVLLYGVTGSGKSELYIRTIRQVIARGKSAICLVPEIALTEQLRRFFLGQFGTELEILHSKLNDTERFLAWKRLESGMRRVVLGPRSAVFAPVPKLGLIIIDEEHEGTYKQETVPRYHAREVAEWRAAHEGALLVMGTATPSLETMFRCDRGQVKRLDLLSRIDEKAMPSVHILDLKQVQSNTPRRMILSPTLCREIETNLRAKQGTLLLLNRRGFSTHIHCPSCGQIEVCGSCQVSLTYHQEDGRLRCHYCNLEKEVPSQCAQCASRLLKFAGYGTEKVESEVACQFPQARIARMDADSIRKKGSHEVILSAFRRREIDILIGTQMIAKGFDFPHVTLVGVILADVGLMLPDFRSAERTFQLLTQVAGRAGRGKHPGRVIIQSYSPHHPSVGFAKDHDYVSFYRHEMAQRKEFKYPPYCRLLNIILRGSEENMIYPYGRTIREMLLQFKNTSPGWRQTEVIGPAPLPFYKLRGHYRWHIMLKFPHGAGVAGQVLEALRKVKKPSKVGFVVDIDPLNIL